MATGAADNVAGHVQQVEAFKYLVEAIPWLEWSEPQPSPLPILSASLGLSWPDRRFPHLLPTVAFEKSAKMKSELSSAHARATIEQYEAANRAYLDSGLEL